MALVFSGLLVSATAAAAADAAKAPTFTKDIAPIFQQKCESCHRPDNMAPMSLITYEEARPWAKSIAARVGSRQMPPWHIDKTIGIQKFKNDRSLSDEQIETILAWVAAGAP
jgi:mono/diheme cytochrome c family protein